VLRRILDADGDIVRVVHADDETTVLETRQDVQPTLDWVRTLRDANDYRDPGWKPVAEVPEFIVEQAMREGWFHDDKAWKRWANDRDNFRFRITDGRF
jgi:thioesterase domain-containing protein